MAPLSCTNHFNRGAEADLRLLHSATDHHPKLFGKSIYIIRDLMLNATGIHEGLPIPVLTSYWILLSSKFTPRPTFCLAFASFGILVSTPGGHTLSQKHIFTETMKIVKRHLLGVKVLEQYLWSKDAPGTPNLMPNSGAETLLYPHLLATI